MQRSIARARLIENRPTAVVAFCLTGIVVALSLRQVARHAQHKSYWLLDLRSILPASAAAVAEVAFCAYLLWLGLVLSGLRKARSAFWWQAGLVRSSLA